MKPEPITALLTWAALCMFTGACGRAQSVSATREGTRPDSEPASVSAAATSVRWFGALHAIIHEGRSEASIRLGEVVPGPHAWGLGALEGLRGEVTVLDDVAWLALPAPDGTARVTKSDLRDGVDARQGAALFVVANVSAWEEVVIERSVPWRELDAFLEAELAARKRPVAAPVPLRIEGPLAKLSWHVIDGSKLAPGSSHADHARSTVRGLLERTEARLVGFFSTAHQGVFTHAGSHSHFHAVAQEGEVSGHVDSVELLPGARLLVARH